jgi:hypothetical protein
MVSHELPLAFAKTCLVSFPEIYFPRSLELSDIPTLQALEAGSQS